MLAHVYNTAKRILSRSPSAQGRSSEARDITPTSNAHGVEVTMVTTRRGTETPGQEVTPRSSVKRKVTKRDLEAQDTPTATKRQKKSTPVKRVAEDTTEAPGTEEESAPESTESSLDNITVAVPTSDGPEKEGLLPIRARSSPKVVVAKPSPPLSTEAEGAEEAPETTQETGFHTPEQPSSSVYATPATRRKPEGSPTPRAKRASERLSTKKSSGHKKTADVEEEIPSQATPTQSNFADEIPSSTYESEQAPIPSQDDTTTQSEPTKVHRRFDSEEPTETQEPVTMNLQGHKRYEAPPADDDDSASDSDEAPEVVTTSAAAQKAASTQRDTARAHLAQQEKEHQKRLARESRLATERAEKAARDAKKAQKAALKRKDSEPEEQTPPLALDRTNLPALLPTSLLSNLPDRRAPTPPPVRAQTAEEIHAEKLSRHIKFLERSEKGVKDVKKGKLSVAVLGKGSKGLAPKADRGSRGVREAWLKGRAVEARKGKSGKVERRVFGNRGFVRGE